MNICQKRTVIVIPARLGSTRFPRKVIAPLFGKPIIQWVYMKAKAAQLADQVIVAADDPTVVQIVQDFGGEAVLTNPDHPSGTDRIHEAIQNIKCDLIVNVQGDEPMIPPQAIDHLIKTMQQTANAEMGTVIVPAKRDEIADNSNIVKVVIATNGKALYFSRSMIPFLRSSGQDSEVYRHWGIYAYTKETLSRFVLLPESSLEKCEKLEQLRALENGIAIQTVIERNLESIGIDTPEDLEKVQKKLAEKGITAPDIMSF